MKAQRNTILAIIIGIISALFLSSTFTINSLLAHTGSHWAWTACLRSLFMIPVMLLPLLVTKKFKTFWQAIKRYPLLFFKWGSIGFGGLYTCMALASLLIPGWLVAATFQINILAGVLLAPFLYNDHRKKIPVRALALSLLVVFGVLIMQLDKLIQLHDGRSLMISFVLVLVGAIVWPLANRKLLIELDSRQVPLNAMQRVLGLTVGSLPLWLVLATYAFSQVGMAPGPQLQASFYSAIFSGFLGGVGFYKATQMVKHDPIALATVEATQVFEIFFTLIGEIWLINASLPNLYGFSGMLVIILGMIFQISLSIQHAKKNNLRSA